MNFQRLSCQARWTVKWPWQRGRRQRQQSIYQLAHFQWADCITRLVYKSFKLALWKRRCGMPKLGSWWKRTNVFWRSWGACTVTHIPTLASFHRRLTSVGGSPVTLLSDLFLSPLIIKSERCCFSHHTDNKHTATKKLTVWEWPAFSWQTVCLLNLSAFWKILMEGPPDTPYEKGMFELFCQFGPDYPVKPPLVRFVTPVSCQAHGQHSHLQPHLS